MNIYKNFLSKENFKKLESVIMNDTMPWYFNENIVRNNKNDFQFTYLFIKDGKQNCHQDMIDLLNPILLKLKFKKINKIKANLLPKEHKIKEHGMHTDQKEGTTGILYINTCNGYTKFENGIKIKSEKNKYIEFNSTL